MKRILLAFVMCSQVAFGNFSQLGNDIYGLDDFGYIGASVSLSTDGSIVAIGAPFGNPGNAYSYSGGVSVYQWDDSSWSRLGGIFSGSGFDYQGFSVSLSSDGSIVAIGAPENQGIPSWTGSGYVHLFKWDGSSWNQLGSKIGNVEKWEAFGYSVSLSADGSVVAIGAPNQIENIENDGLNVEGYVQLQQWDGSSWNQLGSDIDGESELDLFGASVSLSADGSVVAIGAPSNDGNGIDSGHVRLFEWNGSSWNQLGSDIDGESELDLFGASVSLSADGTVVAIGAPNNDGNGSDSGHVRLFEWNGSSWNQLGSDIDGEASGDYSGSSVSLSADGFVVAIGAPNNDGNGSDSGHVRLYQWDGFSWNKLSTDIDGEDSEDYFGNVCISADGSTLAAGAPSNDGNGTDSGHVRVYSIQYLDSDGDGLTDGDEIHIHSTDPNNSDSDDDGLVDGDEVNIHSTDPNDSDSDDDGFDDEIEVSGFDPNVNNDNIIDFIKSNPSIFNLIEGGMTMSEAQAAMRDLRVGSQTFDVSNGTATIRMYVDESSDLTSSWTNTQHVLEVDIPADQDTMFYRFRME